MKKILFVLLMVMLVTTISSCTKKSGCADANGYYDTGYFTYFDEKITLNGFYETYEANGVFVFDECYPTCTIGITKRTIPLDYRNNGEEIRVTISRKLSKNGNDRLGIMLYDINCIEKID